MIFVTVGTHEQSMDRLFHEIERLAEAGFIQEAIFVQAGFSNYKFRYCESRQLISFQEVEKRMGDASVIICHGGPATIMQARSFGKTPVVIPRQHRFSEHVNDHQVEFCRRLASSAAIIPVFDIRELEISIKQAREARSLQSGAPNWPSFSSREMLCGKLIEYCSFPAPKS